MYSPHNRQVHAPNALVGFSPITIALMFVLLMAAASIPILTHPLPPMADYVNHLARTDIINTIDQDPNFARFYTINWQVIPNLMVDLVIPVLDRFMGLYLAGQIFTVLSFVLIVSGTLVLNRVLIGRWSVVPLLAIPLLYNEVLFVGVMNYIFGIGLALWGLAAWIALRERNWTLRLFVSMLFVLALFFCHLFAAGVYALGLFAFELHRLWEQRERPLLPRLVDFVATGFPFLIVLVLLLTGPTVNAPGLPWGWEWQGKFDGLKFALNAYYPLVAIALVAAVVAAAAYGWRERVLGFHSVGWAILAVGAVVYLVMPRSLFAAHLADQRLPIALAFMLIACFDVDLRSRSLRYGFATLLFLLVAARVTEVQAVWDRLSPRSAEFMQSVRSIEVGARVLVVYGDPAPDGEVTNNDIIHAASLATIERSALVTTAFTVKGKHILQVRDEFRRLVETEDRMPPSIPYFLQVAERANADYFWNLWPRNYDYVYVLFRKRGSPNPDTKHLTTVYDGSCFQLYRVNKRT